MKNTKKTILASTALIATLLPIGLSSTGIILESNKVLAAENNQNNEIPSLLEEQQQEYFNLRAEEPVLNLKQGDLKTITVPFTYTGDNGGDLTPEDFNISCSSAYSILTITNIKTNNTTHTGSFDLTVDARQSPDDSEFEYVSFNIYSNNEFKHFYSNMIGTLHLYVVPNHMMFATRFNFVDTMSAPIPDVDPKAINSGFESTEEVQVPEGYSLSDNIQDPNIISIDKEKNSFVYQKNNPEDEEVQVPITKTSGFVQVKYVDEEGNDLGGQDPVPLTAGDSYSFNAPETLASSVDGEELKLKDESQKLITGEFNPTTEGETQTIKVVYKRSYSKFTVGISAMNFLTGEQIGDRTEQAVPFQDELKYFEAPQIEGMRSIKGTTSTEGSDLSDSANKVGVSVKAPTTSERPLQEIHFFYIPDNYTTVKTEFVNDKGETLKESELIAGKIGTSQAWKAPEIVGYKVKDATESNKDVTFADKDSERKIVYVKDEAAQPAKLTVKYIDAETGAELKTAKVIEGTIGQEVKFSAEKIDGYTLDKKQETDVTKTLTANEDYVFKYHKDKGTTVDNKDEEKPSDGDTENVADNVIKDVTKGAENVTKALSTNNKVDSKSQVADTKAPIKTGIEDLKQNNGFLIMTATILAMLVGAFTYTVTKRKEN